MSDRRAASDPEVQLEARGLELGYGRRTVLRAVDLVVRRGEFWGFVGPNGSGKTTLLRALLMGAGVRRGELLVRVPSARIGYVPQRCDLSHSLPTTVREFVSLGLVGTSADRVERQRRLAWALEQVRLTGKETTAYWSLSGGQRQRALVARALVRQPVVLLLDEPTSGLDLEAHGSVLGAVQRLHGTAGVTVVWVAHELRTLLRYATHVAVFGGGVVVAGARQEVVQPEVLRRAYGVDVDLDGLSGEAVVGRGSER